MHLCTTCVNASLEGANMFPCFALSVSQSYFSTQRRRRTHHCLNDSDTDKSTRGELQRHGIIRSSNANSSFKAISAIPFCAKSWSTFCCQAKTLLKRSYHTRWQHACTWHGWRLQALEIPLAACRKSQDQTLPRRCILEDYLIYNLG